jgi:replicative superfamily II helicase
MKLPTASGKTFIAGMGSSFNILKRNKKVVLVVLNEILKCQM